MIEQVKGSLGCEALAEVCREVLGEDYFERASNEPQDPQSPRLSKRKKNDKEEGVKVDA